MSDIIKLKSSVASLIELKFEPIFRDFDFIGEFFIAGGAVVSEIEKILGLPTPHHFSKDIDIFCSSKSVYDQFLHFGNDVKYENKHCAGIDNEYFGKYLEIIKRGYCKSIKECLSSFDLVHCAVGIDPHEGMFVHKDALNCIQNKTIKFNRKEEGSSNWNKTILRAAKYMDEGYSMDKDSQKFFVQKIIVENDLIKKFKDEMYAEPNVNLALDPIENLDRAIRKMENYEELAKKGIGKGIVDVTENSTG